MIENPKIKAVTLTGSTPAGRSVAAAAGAVLKKSVLELGGSDPYLILEDADIETAARLCVASLLINAGQSCIGAKRFIVVDSVYDRFKSEFVRLMGEARFGDPLDSQTTIGPLARTDLRDELHQQVESSRQMGATVLLGGFVPEGNVPFYPATVLENVVSGMPAYHEELFGPVAVLHRAKDVDEAIRIANQHRVWVGCRGFYFRHRKRKRAGRKRARSWLRICERLCEIGSPFAVWRGGRERLRARTFSNWYPRVCECENSGGKVTLWLKVCHYKKQLLISSTALISGYFPTRPN